MVDKKTRQLIDKLWNNFWSGGISNPFIFIEQISYLLYLKELEYQDQKQKQISRSKKKKFKSIFPKDKFRWSEFKKMSPDDLFELIQDEVFPFIRNHSASSDQLGVSMRDAVFSIPKPTLLYEAVMILDTLNWKDTDIKGDLYEYLLSKLSSSGVNGQFRTPRHIINLMVELVKPILGEKICDPASGTAGFLTSSYEHITKNGDTNFTEKEIQTLKNDMFFGIEFDASMVRISQMNMMLHGLNENNILYRDTLSNTYKVSEEYDVVLANPPFTGTVDLEGLHQDFLGFSTRKTELLFLTLINRILVKGGRCAVIIPDGVLFSQSNAHRNIRRLLIEENRLEAVISLPRGTFRPYAGVAASILIFYKGEETDKIWFYGMQNDGFSLDDKRQEIKENDIPDLLFNWNEKSEHPKKGDKWFWVKKEEVVKNKYELALSQFKIVTQRETKEVDLKKIIRNLEKNELEIMQGLSEIRDWLEQ